MEEQTNTMEYREVHSFFHDFFRAICEERSIERVSAMLAPDILCVGLRSGEVARNRHETVEFLIRQVRDVPEEIQYVVSEYLQHECGPHCWTCLVQLELSLQTEYGIRVRYQMRLTGTLRKEDGEWHLTLLHVSEGETKYQPRVDHPFPGYSQLGNAFSQLVPGGVISTCIDNGFPLLIANEQFLKMIHYDNFDQFRREIQGQFLLALHPDDRKVYEAYAHFIDESGKQCECEYRVRRADGGHVWIHDIGRKTVADNGLSTILSTLIDVTEQKEEQKKLQWETEMDTLTGVYNRKGARRFMNEQLRTQENWLFCIADLDNFKQVNDIYGHKQGDGVLIYFASLLDKYFSRMGTVYRLGGDEFGVFISGYSSLSKIRSVMQQVCDQYAGVMELQCPKAHSTLSIGGVYGEGRQTVATLYDQADQNLYKVKEHQKGWILLTELVELSHL